MYLSIFSKETTGIVFLQRNNCTISWSVPCLSSNNLDIKIPNDALKLSLAVKTLLWLLFWCWILGSWKNLNCKKTQWNTFVIAQSQSAVPININLFRSVIFLLNHLSHKNIHFDDSQYFLTKASLNIYKATDHLHFLRQSSRHAIKLPDIVLIKNNYVGKYPVAI